MKVYLASKSPRRRQLLEQIGIDYQCISSRIDETPLNNEKALEYVKRMAVEKTSAGWIAKDRVNDYPVLAADTCVVLDDVILGKPKDERDAMKMLLSLSGNTHKVLTGVALRQSQKVKQLTSVTEVTFGEFPETLLSRYIKSGDCFDKAGSYGIQGFAGQFVSSIKGSYSGVVGLPLFETASLIAKFK